MEYLLLSNGGVIPVDEQDNYTDVESCMREYPGSEHYWRGQSGIWRRSFINVYDVRKTEILRSGPPEVIKLAAMLE